MTEDSGPSSAIERKPGQPPDSLSSQRVFKKSSPNNKLTLYLSSRDLVVSEGKVDRLQGVLLVDPEFVGDRKVYGQVTLTFRYGREDEEVMGLKFCNEAVMCLSQLYPTHAGSQPQEANTPLQDALLKRLGANAYPFTMDITPLAPPSVQLVPAKEYNGAPIGTSYDVRAYIADRVDEKLHRRTTVRMGIRVVQRVLAPPSPYLYSPGGPSPAKEKRQKMTLFGSKSAPADSKSKFSPPAMLHRAQSTEVQVEMTRRETATPKVDDLKRPSINIERCSIQDLSERVERYIDDVVVGDRSSGHVTFKEEDDKENDGKEGENSGDVDEHVVKSERSGSIEDSEASQYNRFRSSCGGKRPSVAAFLAEVPAPHALVEKPFLLSDGKVELEAQLNKAIYYHGEEVHVTCKIKNNSSKSIRRIKVFVVQHVDVCMFSNGKFKNVVAIINTKNNCPVQPGNSAELTYSLLPTKSATKNWIALEDSYTKSGTSLASSVTSSNTVTEDRNVFAIYVSYYVKVKLLVSVMGGDVSIKLPFTLLHTCDELDSPTECPNMNIHRKSVVEEVKPEKDGT